jgi:hypothetical protein
VGDIYVHVCVCVCVYIYTYMYVYTHTHTHTHTHRCEELEEALRGREAEMSKLTVAYGDLGLFFFIVTLYGDLGLFFLVTLSSYKEI